MNVKKIIDSQYFPIGIKKANEEQLLIDMEIIKSFMPAIINADIEYLDGTRITWYPVFKEEIN